MASLEHFVFTFSVQAELATWKKQRQRMAEAAEQRRHGKRGGRSGAVSGHTVKAARQPAD